MRYLVFFCCLLSMAHLQAQDTLSTTHDTRKIFRREDYLEDFSNMINVTPFALKSTTGFTLSGNKNIQYAPNEGVSLGIKLQHKWLGFAISYSPRKFQNENIGQSDFMNIMLNSYGKKIGFDVYYLTYRGYIVENLRDLERIPPGTNENVHPNRFRYDLHTLNTGFNAYYIFNSKKFSYRSTFLQNEWQKKSAGSFMLTASMNYYQLEGDSTVVPVRYDPLADEQARLKSGDFLSVALMPGYTHTFVVFKRLFLTLSPSVGFMFQEQHYLTEHDMVVNRQTFIPRLMGRTGLGFNSRRFYAGISSVNDVYNIQLAKGTRINNQISSFTLYTGFRLGVPRPMQKYSDLLGKLDPLRFIGLQVRKQ